MSKNKKMELLVRNVSTKLLVGAVLKHVEVESDTDSDGEPIYKIALVFDHPDRIEKAKLASFVRHLRSEMGTDIAFPIVSFRSETDDKGLRSEAA